MGAENQWMGGKSGESTWFERTHAQLSESPVYAIDILLGASYGVLSI